MPECVVGPPALGIGQNLVRLRCLLELLLRLRVVAVDVGVKLTREAPEGLLDLDVGGAALDPEDLVVVPLHGRH